MLDDDVAQGELRGSPDADGLRPSQLALLQLVLAGVSRPSRMAAERGISRQAVYAGLYRLSAGGWVRRVGYRSRHAKYDATDKALAWAQRRHAARSDEDVA